MPLVPIRNLGQYGVNTDVDALDLPLEAFSYAANCRFTEGKITRGPVFAKLGENTGTTVPRWSYSYSNQGAASTILVMTQDGKVATVSPTGTATLTYTDVSEGTWVASSQAMSYTATMLAGVVYVNRQDRVPWSLVPGAGSFSKLAGGWDSTWRCRALRTFNGALVALNITKGAIDYPTMVKTSDLAVYGTIPSTWTAGTTNSATENVLADLPEAIIDGMALRDKFMIYTTNQTWQMYLTGDSLIYGYQRLFGNYGLIGQNCVAEINNLHFCFGDSDIWVHDGYTPKTLANGRVRNFIFNNLVRSESYQFFTWVNPKLNEVMFCYVSTDPFCAFPASTSGTTAGCNRAAVYNWQYDTWTFYDLPYIVGGAVSQTYTSGGSGLTYADFSSISYNTASGQYQAFADNTRTYNLAIGRGGTVVNAVLPLQTTGSWSTSAMHLYSYESLDNLVGIGTLVDVTNAPAFLENTQMDMDQIVKEARGYKAVSSIYPEGRVASSANPLTFWYGATDYSGQSVTWDAPMTFDGDSLYKLDFISPGRYLSFRMAQGNPARKFTLSGMDLDFRLFSHR